MLRLSKITGLVILLVGWLISSASIPNTLCVAFVVPRTSFEPSTRLANRPISFQLRAVTGTANGNTGTGNNLHDESTRNIRVLSPVSAAAAVFASPLLAIADDNVAKAPATYVTRSFETSREKYFPLSLPNSVTSRRILTTLSSLGGYLPNQYGTSNTLLGSTFCAAGSSKSDRLSLLGQIELGLGKARFGSTTAATVPLNGVGGVPIIARNGNTIQSFFSRSPQGGNVVIVYGPQIDISSVGYLSGSDQYGIGRSGIGSCGASAAVLNELRSMGGPGSNRERGNTSDEYSAEWSVKSLVTGQENDILSKLREDLIEANVDLNSSDQNYLLAEVTKKLYNLVSDTLIAEIDACFTQKGFWNDIQEVVLLGGIVINRDVESSVSSAGENYFKPVTFQSIHQLSDGSLESTNLLGNLFDTAYDELTLPGNDMDIKIPEVSLPDVSIPDIKVKDVSIPDIKIPEVSIPVRVPDIPFPDITLPEITTNARVGTTGAAAAVVGVGGVLSYGQYLKSKKKDVPELGANTEDQTKHRTKPVEKLKRATPAKKKAVINLPFFSNRKSQAEIKDGAKSRSPNALSANTEKQNKDEKDMNAKWPNLSSIFGEKKKKAGTISDTTAAPEVVSKGVSSIDAGERKRAPFKLPEVKMPKAKLPEVKRPPFFGRREAGRVQFDGSVSKTNNRIAVSLTKDLLTLSMATDRGQKASWLQQNTAKNIIEQLEASSTVPEKAVFSPMIEGTWKLIYSDTYAFRSNPFFMARRSSCGDDNDLIQYYDASCVIFQGALAMGTVGDVRQIVRIGKMPLLISEVELFRSVLVSTAALRPVTTSNGEAAWAVSLRSTEVKGQNPPIVRQLRDVKSMMSGIIPAPAYKTTYLDDSLRISRDQDGSVYVFGKISDSKEPTDYSKMAAGETTKLI
mmetsp:Transcript_14877/g.32365  ORF Transcript_14877/g.32365 Transcript_14877/m.32365 type:complete len:910 (+) Transcript_14877:284-3013(+)